MAVKYYLKDGSIMRRSYNVPAQKDMVSDTSTVARKLVQLCVVPEVYLDNMFGGDYQNVVIKEGSMDVYNEGGEYEDRRISEEDAKKLYQAVVEDAKDGNFKEFVKRGFLRYRDMEEAI